MITTAFITLALLALSVAAVIRLIRQAPEGQEDVHGFRFVTRDLDGLTAADRADRAGSLKAPLA